MLTKVGTQKILLDTHVWIWLANDDKKIPSFFKKFIQKGVERSAIFLSPISFWELGMLVEKKRIRLNIDCLNWINQALAGLRVAAITPKIAVMSSQLPGDMHGDPADRLLVATAYERKYALATVDEKLLKYAKANSLNVIDPCK